MWLLVTLFHMIQLKLVLQCISRSSMLGGIPSHRLNFRNCTLERPALAYTHHHWADFEETVILTGREWGGECAWGDRDRECFLLQNYTTNALLPCNVSQSQLNFANVSFHWLFPKLQIRKSSRSRLVVAVYHGSLFMLCICIEKHLHSSIS